MTAYSIPTDFSKTQPSMIDRHWKLYGYSYSRMAELVRSENGQQQLARQFKWETIPPWRKPK